VSSRGWLIFVVWILAPVIVAKVADIKAIEAVLMLLFGWCGLDVVTGGEFKLERPLAILLAQWAVFLAAASLLAVISLRLEFHPPTVAKGNLLHSPPFTSAAILMETLLCVGALVFFAQMMGRDARLLRLAARLYVWIGVLYATYAIISWTALVFSHADLIGAYLTDSGVARARALFAEGGEFGLYAVSVILMGAFRRYVLKDMSRAAFWAVVVPVLLLSMILSKSKAGALCLIGIFAWRSVVRMRIRYLPLMAAVALLLVWTTPIVAGLEGYWIIYQHFDEVVATHAQDPSIGSGRAAAVSVMPKLVKLHPFLGVGIGNYGLVRNDPEVGIPGSDEILDRAGIGLLSYTGELGLPLFAYLVWLVARPWRIVRKAKPRLPELAIVLAAFQLFAQGIEVQITFVYPWLVSAIALGYFLCERDAAVRRCRTCASIQLGTI